MSSGNQELAKAITPKETATAAQNPGSASLTRGVVQSLNSDGTVELLLEGSSTAIPASVVGTCSPLQTVEVLLASPRALVFGEGAAGDVKTSEVYADQRGWWVEDGRATTATAQPALAAALSKTGSFNIPDRRGKFAVGVDGVNYVLGVSGGSTTIQAANLPVTSPWQPNDPGHTHNIFDLGHSHTVPNLAVEVLLSTLGLASPGDNKASYSAPSTSTNQTLIGILTGFTGITLHTNSAGGATIYNPPYYPIVYLIKL